MATEKDVFVALVEVRPGYVVPPDSVFENMALDERYNACYRRIDFIIATLRALSGTFRVVKGDKIGSSVKVDLYLAISKEQVSSWTVDFASSEDLPELTRVEIFEQVVKDINAMPRRENTACALAQQPVGNMLLYPLRNPVDDDDR